MKASGCEVPKYMLEIKKIGKSKAKKLRYETPKRGSISTDPRYKRRLSGKQNREGTQDLKKKVENGSLKNKEKFKENGKIKGKVSDNSEKHKAYKIKSPGDRKKTLLSKKVKSKKGLKKPKQSVNIEE